VKHVALGAFFLSKFEMTQGQWQRHCGANPSTYQAASSLVGDGWRSHPVETMGWTAAERVARELGLVLPTEARWEYACRAGSSGPWATGAAPTSLAGHANIADRHARDNGGAPLWDYELELDDGFTVHAPVGSFLPNAFGLHDMLGNIAEFCLDTWEDWSLVEPRPADGLFSGSEEARVHRGGAFSSGAAACRSANRQGWPPHLTPIENGLRPARDLEL
jgi:formylglycine-generating enzyme required for sulfatase activity